MLSLRALGLFVLSTLAMSAAPGPGGSLQVGPTFLRTGGQANISYSNPARAGDTVTIDIDDGGFPNTQTDQVPIQLDENGNGTAKWDVPEGWDGAKFNAPDCPEVVRWILGPGEETPVLE